MTPTVSVAIDCVTLTPLEVRVHDALQFDQPTLARDLAAQLGEPLAPVLGALHHLFRLKSSGVVRDPADGNAWYLTEKTGRRS